MSWWVPLAGGAGLLLMLLFAGVPVFVGFLLMNIAGLLIFIGPRGFGLFTNSIYETATSQPLTAVALFVLMGEILFRSGTIEVLFDSVDKLVGRVRGRLYVVVCGLSTLFGALSGSAVAVAALLGRSALPEMQQRGYDKRLSASTILSGASLAPIIPPSLLAIIVGSLTDVSIAGLLIAGIVPGLILAGITLGYIYLRVGMDPRKAPGEASGEPEDKAGGMERGAGRHALNMLPFLLVVFSVMGLILLGVATPSESAATGVLGAMLTAAVFKRFSLSMMRDAVLSAVKISVMILVIVCTAKLFSQLLSFTGATRGLVGLVTDLSVGPGLTFLIMMAIPFVVCMFIDQIAFMLLAVPIYTPVIKAYEFDPILFWALFLINLTVGSLTPPFGYTLFSLKGAAPGLSINDVYAAAWPVVAIFVAGMVLFWSVPGLVTFLPDLL